MISNISIDKLRPHPNNPRKDLGDLTELSESIKANGILQNLTVVPDEDDTYTVIIGHRRMAASKLAGLTELPCAIVEMSEKDQLGTMLLENMQRSDLTIYEEAQGIQLMIELGETVASISKITGMSKSKIYGRKKLCELDPEKFKQAQERGATLEDYAKLDKITDPKLKNRALDSIGTPNFDNAVRTAVADEKYNENLAKWETLLSSFATRIADWDISKHEVVSTFYMTTTEYDSFKIPKDADEVDYYYIIGVNSWDRERIRVLKEHKKTSLQEANEQEERRRKEEDRQLRGKKLKELAISFSNARAEFIRNYTCSTNTAIGKFLRIVNFYILCSNSDSRWDGIYGYNRLTRIKQLCEVIGFDYSVYEKKFEKGDNLMQMMHYVPEFENQVQNEPEKLMLALIYINIESLYVDSDKYIKTWDYDNVACDLTIKQDKYIQLLKSLGYEISDEERSLYDGTHELYTPEEDEEFLDVEDMPESEEE